VFDNKKRCPWAAHHSDQLPKKAWLPLILQEKTLQSTKDSCGFFPYLKKSPILFRCYAVLKWQLF
jgi:hypothetical protein